MLRCGVARPKKLGPTSELFTADGVDWLPVEQRGGAYAFTATGRVAYVWVHVPKAQAPGANVLAGLAGPVRSTVPSPKT